MDGPTIAALAAVTVALINGAYLIVVTLLVRDVRDVKHSTNSMREELVRLARVEGRAEGVIEGRQLQKNETAEK